MLGINVKRWFVGGIAAGAVMWVVEGVSSLLYMEGVEAALQAHGLEMEMSASVWLMTIVVSLLAGLTLVFFYAACRPRFGAGPRTAVTVAVALWVGGYLLSLLGYSMVGLYPGAILVQWGAVGLVEMILASLVGGWLYRESPLPREGAAA
jgi:hypothetical protein